MNTSLKLILRPLLRIRAIKRRLLRAFIRWEVRKRWTNNEPIKVIIGAGASANSPFGIVGASGTPYEGWLNTDYLSLDVLKRSDWAGLFPPAGISRVLSDMMFEHLTKEQFRKSLDVMSPFLARDARVRAAVPDGNHPDRAYIEHVRPGGTGPGADDHKVLYSYSSFCEVLSAAGYDFELLEYFDEKHDFQRKSWSDGDGHVRRSAGNDPRNKDGKLNYTSLIIDCWRHTSG